MLRPAGRPLAEKESVSVASGSENEPDTSRLTLEASAPVWFASAVETGASLAPVTVTVTVAVEVPPSPSLIV